MKKIPHLLLVEDDLSFGAVLKSYLELQDFELTWVDDGARAHDAFNAGSFDLVLLDVMLPHEDGFSIARKIRAGEKQTPIIFITAKTLREDMLRGYRTGADDYITKPFDSEILLYKIRAVLSRSARGLTFGQPEGPFKLGIFTFDHRSRTLINSHSGHKQTLTPKENELLHLLVQQNGELLPKVVALNTIWGDANYFTTRSMDVYINKLRKHLTEDHRIQLITMHGDGYRLIVDSE